jgi:hypothetical protein
MVGWINCYAVLSGELWPSVEGVTERALPEHHLFVTK